MAGRGVKRSGGATKIFSRRPPRRALGLGLEKKSFTKEGAVRWETKDKNVAKPGKGSTADRMTVPWQDRLGTPKKYKSI